MPSYKVDALVRLLQKVESPQNEDENSQGDNVIEDTFNPVSETLNAQDSVSVSVFTASQQVWAGSTGEPNWRWGYGGKWNA